MSEDNNVVPSQYGVEILLENTEFDKTKDPGFPTDAYNVIYSVNEEEPDRIDVCRGNRIKIFDFYYDKYGKGVIKSITWGSGKINPRVWLSNRETTKKKRKR